jgi:hypothetical protein
MKLSVVVGDKAGCRRFVSENHYSGKCPGVKYCFALLDSGAISGYVVYSVPASYTLCRGVCGIEFSPFVLELSRLAITSEEKNAASFLIGKSIRMLPNCVLVSYADCNEHVGHVGYVYQATNWIYTGQGSAEPLWVHPVTGGVVSYTRRHIDEKAGRIGLDYRDLVRRKQLGKHRYVNFSGSVEFTADARRHLRYAVLPYPKGQTHRHLEKVLITSER